MYAKRTNKSIMRILAAGSMLIAVTGSSMAAGYSERVRTDCAGDYQSFCAQYVPESSEARSCFEANRKQLSKRCVSALVSAGMVPAKYLKK